MASLRFKVHAIIQMEERGLTVTDVRTALDNGEQFDGVKVGNTFVPGHMLGQSWYPLALAANIYEAQKYASYSHSDQTMHSSHPSCSSVDRLEDELMSELHSSKAVVRAMPTRQLHITAGNSPIVPILSLLRAVWTKSPCALKLPSGAVLPGSLVALLSASR